MTGVEGYVESAASGMIAGMNAARIALGEEPLVFPEDTVLGSMPAYITSADPKHFQPMNANFGLLPKPERRIRNKKEKMSFLPIVHWTVLPDSQNAWI